METAVLPTKKRKFGKADGEPFAIFTELGVFICGLKNEGLENEEAKILGWVEESEFRKYFHVPQLIDTGIIPPGTIYYEQIKQNGNIYYIIGVQKPPSKIAYTNAQHVVANLELHLPYLQLFTLIRDNGTIRNTIKSFITCTKNTLTTLDQNIYIPPLGNISANGQVCFGRSAAPVGINEKTPAEITRILLNHFLQSPFNEEIATIWPSEFTDFLTWNKHFNNMDAALTLDYVLNRYTNLQTLLSYIRNEVLVEYENRN